MSHTKTQGRLKNAKELAQGLWKQSEEMCPADVTRSDLSLALSADRSFLATPVSSIQTRRNCLLTLFCLEATPHSASLEKKAWLFIYFFFLLYIKYGLNFVQLLLTVYMKCEKLAIYLCLRLFFQLFFFYYPARFNLKSSQSCSGSLPPFARSAHLPTGFLLQLLVLPHFFGVFVLRAEHRDTTTSESTRNPTHSRGNLRLFSLFTLTGLKITWRTVPSPAASPAWRPGEPPCSPCWPPSFALASPWRSWWSCCSPRRLFGSLRARVPSSLLGASAARPPGTGDGQKNNMKINITSGTEHVQ